MSDSEQPQLVAGRQPAGKKLRLKLQCSRVFQSKIDNKNRNLRPIEKD